MCWKNEEKPLTEEQKMEFKVNRFFASLCIHSEIKGLNVLIDVKKATTKLLYDFGRAYPTYQIVLYSKTPK